jgi:hypothetical protein
MTVTTKVLLGSAVAALALALALEAHLRAKDVDRRSAVDASRFVIDNEFCAC